MLFLRVSKFLNSGVHNFQCARMSFYAVAKGFRVGIYESWAECQVQIKGFKGAKFKKFPTYSEAESFIKNGGDVACGSYKHYSGTMELPPDELSLDAKVDKYLKEHGIENKARGRNAQTKYKEPKKRRKKMAEAKEFWPEDDDGTDNSDTEANLLAAMEEVEGISEIETKHTKYDFTLKQSSTETDCGPSSRKIPKYDSKVWEPAGMKDIGPFQFFIDSEGYVIVYTDGSCLNNGQANACAGYGVYFGDNHPLNIAKPVTGRATNNVGEIQAAIYAIQIAKDLSIAKLCISTDSQFMINAVTKWIGNWKRHGWRLNNGTPVKNEVDFKKLDSLLLDKTMVVKWNYVKAHQGIKGNEIADKLAREGADMYRRQQRENDTIL